MWPLVLTLSQFNPFTYIVWLWHLTSDLNQNVRSTLLHMITIYTKSGEVLISQVMAKFNRDGQTLMRSEPQVDKNTMKQQKSEMLSTCCPTGEMILVVRTGLMSLCRNPTSCMASMALRIWAPRRSVVLRVKQPRDWLRRSSARFLPCSVITT